MTMEPETRKPRVLAVSSGGGHWVQLLRLRPAFEDCEVSYATVRDGYRADVPDQCFHRIPDCNRWHPVALMHSTLAIARLVLGLRPDVVVTTGAAPGFLAARIGKLAGARVVWIDSIANVRELSLSGSRAGTFADLWLTQWPHLAASRGCDYRGNVL